MADGRRDKQGMRILIQGAGSIGQRHYRNARTLGMEAAFIRSRSSMTPFQQAFFDERAGAGDLVRSFASVEEALDGFAPDAAVIATPNHLHATHAEAMIRAGLPTLIEKPIDVDSASARSLAQLSTSKGVPCLVGYNLRFHPHLVLLKTMLASGSLGAVLSIMCEVGENIEDWHLWEDYRQTYAPYVHSGGGALLCFSHDIDYLIWLFGAPSGVFASGGKVTPLVGDAEDLIQALLRYPDGSSALLHVDYWQRPKARKLKIIAERGTATWSEHDRSLITWDHTTALSVQHPLDETFVRNTMFLDEMAHFGEVVAGREDPKITIDDGISVLDVVARIKSHL